MVKEEEIGGEKKAKTMTSYDLFMPLEQVWSELPGTKPGSFGLQQPLMLFTHPASYNGNSLIPFE